VSLGANQQEIISRLYKSKSLGLLKLWGRVLARLKQVNELSLVYSIINRSDMARSEATEEDSGKIIHEMISQLGFAKLFLLFKEDENTTMVYFHSSLPLDAKALFSRFEPAMIGFQTLRFSVPAPAGEAEKQVIQLLTDEINKYKVNV
jgi:hypothetical protein